MNTEHEWLQEHLVTSLGQLFSPSVYLVFAVPQGVALLNKNGQHILIRIDAAKLRAVG